MVIRQVTGQEPSQMALVQDDHVVQAFAAETPEQPVDGGGLPRRPWRGDDVLDSQTPHPLATPGAVEAVSSAQQIPRGLVPWAGVADLLGGPLSGGMCRHSDVDDATAMVGQDDEDTEHLACHRWHDQAIQGDHILDVVVEAGLPCRRGRLA
jgi:hypothetical protein